MAKAHISPANNAANISNANKGTSGQNLQRCQNQGNRGWQMNPQNPANKSNNSSKRGDSMKSDVCFSKKQGSHLPCIFQKKMQNLPHCMNGLQEEATCIHINVKNAVTGI